MSYNPLQYQWISRPILDALKKEASRNRSIILQAKSFIDNIASGNLNIAYKSYDELDELGSALQNMQKQMKDIAQADFEKNWSAEGLAKFVQILRTDSKDLSILADKIIAQLVKYLNANQGALFMVNDTHSKDLHLQMLACYAYDRKKHLQKKVYLGEGLAGQAWLEKDSIYLTDIPQNYTHITSGLGHATPREVLIVPLKNNEEVLGVVELASFNKFEPYQIVFLEKLGESIANTIITVKNSEVNTALLIESQKTAEEMKAQEEEMRQNLEELTATQEAQSRLEKELKARLSELELARNEIDSIRKEEALKTSKQMELQNKIMASTVAKFKSKEEELIQKIQQKDEIIRQLTEKPLLENQN